MPKYAKTYSAAAVSAERKQDGLAALHHNNLEVALANFQKLTAQDYPNLPQTLAEIYFRKALLTPEVALQLNHLQLALAQTPNDGRIHFHLGRCYQRLGHYKEAEKAYAQAQALGYARPSLGLLRALLTLAKKPTTALDKLPDLTPAERATLTPLSLLLRQQPQTLLQTFDPSWVAHAKTDTKAEVLAAFWQGLAHYAAGDPATAVTTLGSIAPLALPSVAEALRAVYLGQAQAMLGHTAAAHTTWQAALQRATKAHLPLTVIAHLQNALVQSQLPAVRSLLAAGQAAEALQALGPLLKETPRDFWLLSTKVEALNQLAQAALAQGQWAAALPHLEAIHAVLDEAVVPGDHLPLARNLAITYEALERWPEAASAWHTVLNMLPTRERKSKKTGAAPPTPAYGMPLAEFRQWVRRRLLLNYQRAGDLSQALTLYKAAIKAEPADLALRLELVEAYLADQRDQAARNELNRILAQDPHHTPAKIKLAEVHFQRSEWYAGEQLLDQVLQADPKNAEARQTKVEMLRTRGHDLLEWGMAAEAQKLFVQAVALAPQDMELYINLGDAELRLGHTEAAHTQFETVLGFNKVAGYIAVFESWVWHKDGTKAQQVLARAEAAGLANPAFYAQAAAACLDMTQDLDETPFASFFGLKARKKKPKAEIDQWGHWADTLLKQAQAATPDTAEALQAIVAQLGQRHPQKALTYVEQLAQLKPDDPQVLLQLAVLQAMNNQRRLAQDTVKKAIQSARAAGSAMLVDELEKLLAALDMPGFGMPNFFADPLDDFEDDFYR